MDTISTGTWRISLPTDWIEQGETEAGALYFESNDGEKAMYIATWHLGDSPVQTPTEVADSFKSVEMRTLHKMEGYVWTTISEETLELSDTTILLSDNFAQAKSHRMLVKILARPPIVVRAAFHDYDCSNYASSKSYFDPIIGSLEFNVPV